jgi:hypothetical protein
MSAATVPRALPAAQPPRGVECRVYERHTCGVETACQPIAARSSLDIQWPAAIRDISETGVGVVLGRRFERGTGLAIEVPGTGTRPPDTLLAKVVHVTALPGGQWRLGCTFVSRLSVDEVRAVAALGLALKPPPPAVSSLPPSSRAPASNGSAPASPPDKPLAQPLVIPDLWFEGTTDDGKVVRVPVRRLFLTGSWPLAAGTTLRVWVGDKHRAPTGLMVQVVSCRKQARGWKVSYRLMEPMSAQTLRALGFAG